MSDTSSLAESSKDLSENNLVPTLNSLITSLFLPFELESPQDLTPSLLLAILESILESRLPIAPSIRESRTTPAKIEAMKIFLGVLESDVLQMDVGLSDVDPRKLAAGSWDEVVFVGELLCWLGKKRGILVASDEVEEDFSQSMLLRPEPSGFSHITDVPRHPRVASPSTRSSATNTNLSMHSSHTTSNTSVGPPSHYSSTQSFLLPPRSPISSPEPHQPRCIHEVEDPSFLFPSDEEDLNSEHSDNDLSTERPDISHANASFCDCSTTEPLGRGRPIRYTGWINEVDDDAELESFTSSNDADHDHTPSKNHRTRGLYGGNGHSTPRLPSTTSRRTITKHTSPTEHTLALMNERARLLSELAKLKQAKRS